MKALPVRHAVALAAGSGDTFLFVRRSRAAREFPGFWSLPVTTVSAEDFASIELGRPMAVPGFSCEGTCLNIAERFRSGYSVRMALFQASGGAADLGAVPQLASYDSTELAPVLHIVESCARKVGLSLSMLLQHLMVAEEIPSPQDYLELGPEHVGLDLDLASDAELWRLANFAANFVRSEGLERYGTLVKRATADLFVRTWVERLNPGVVLDLGCGDALLADEMAASVERVIGVDHSIAGSPRRDNVTLIENDFLLVDRSCFGDADLAVLNLAIQWVESLEALLAMLDACRRLVRVLVTFCPAEFSKNGHWVRGGSGQWCWLVRDAMDEGPSLTMIDSRIGPVRYYRRQLPTIVNAFARHGYSIETMDYLNVERSEDEATRSTIYERFPAARRNERIPQFVGIVFARL